MGRIKNAAGTAAKKIRYRRLRERMHAYDVSAQELADRCLISKATLSHKFTGKTPWRSDEMWVIMRYLDIPDDELYLYFPPDGRDLEDARQTSADAYLRQTNKSAVSDSSLYALKELIDRIVDEAM